MTIFPMTMFTKSVASASPITLGSSVSTVAPSGSKNHVINLPSGIQNGDLLVVLCWNNSGTFTVPSGWTIFSGSSTATDQPDIWKYASGTEGSTLTIVSTVSEKWSGIAYRITGVDAAHAAPEMQSTSGSSGNPDPPSITPSWGATVNTLYIATYGGAAVSSYPSGYTLGQIGTGTPSESAACVTKKSSPENPGVFTTTASDTGWLSRTIACKGAF